MPVAATATKAGAKKTAAKKTAATRGRTLKAVEMTPEEKAQEKAKISRASRHYVRTNTNTRVGRAETVLVTPEKAKYWLTMRRKPNRKISQVVVDQYVDDIKHKRWIENGEAMKFIGFPSEDGDNAAVDFFDGGHRAMAIVQSGIALEVDVVFGLPTEAKDTVDIGRRRTATNVLEMDGTANASLVAGAARLILTYDKEAPEGVRAGRNITPLAIKELVHAQPNRFQEAARAAMRYWAPQKATRDRPGKRGLKPIPPSTLAYCYMKFVDRAGRDAAQCFLDLWLKVVRHEVGVSEAGTAIVALANRFQTAKDNHERIDRPTQISLIFRAWNGWRKGEDLDRLPARSRSGVVPIPDLR